MARVLLGEERNTFTHLCDFCSDGRKQKEGAARISVCVRLTGVSFHCRGRSSGSGGYDIQDGLRYEDGGDMTK